MDIKAALNKIASRQDLTGEEMRAVMTTIMEGNATQAQLEILGVTGVTTANLAVVQQAIARQVLHHNAGTRQGVLERFDKRAPVRGLAREASEQNPWMVHGEHLFSTTRPGHPPCAAPALRELAPSARGYRPRGPENRAVTDGAAAPAAGGG